ncbi:MAG: sigma-70 family RNA polymerase sigma factor [Planctomycetota bacterium]|jgi:RNA polymerase sigma-70 factor (ECF subfamily)
MSEEAGIIKRIVNGDVDSFRLLVQRYQRPVISMIRNLINDRGACEDLAQEVFFTAYRKLSSFDPARSKFSTWLFSIARNKSINFLRRKKIFFASNLPQRADSHGPDDELARKEFFEELDRVLEKLPGKQQRAFVLAEIEKLAYEDIAQIEGVPIGTVRSRINRAKKKLAARLKNYDESMS